MQFKPDVIHTHGAKENTLASIANVLSQRAYCVRTAHGAPEFSISWRQIHKQLFGLADWFCGRFLQQKIIAVSGELAKKLEASYPTSKIVVVENGIDIAEIQAKALLSIPGFKQQYPDAYHIGIVGRLVPVKRVDLFIETAALLYKEHLDKPIYFHIIGDGPLKEELEQQVIKSDLESIITFHGHQSNSAAYLKALDILLMTSDHEGLPMTALEAMVLETPIISHNIGALKTALQNQQGGTLAPEHSGNGYAQTVMRVLNETLQQELSTAGLKYCSQFFTATRNAQQIQQYYSA